jgi:hypothetical protein
MDRINLQTRTLYAELLEQLQVLEASRTISSLKGSFAIRENNGTEFVYFHCYFPGGKLEQIYIGKRNEQTESLMREHAEGKAEALEIRERIKRLTAQVSAGFDMPTDKAMVRVIRSLADAGVFRNGGVLVGTHAFKAIGTMLGVRWPMQSQFTTDIDIAADRKVTIAIPTIKADIPAAIESLKMGFYPVGRLNLKEPSTTYAIRKSQLRLDILTPKTTESDAPIFVARFNCAAAPISYLAYPLEKPAQAVIVDTEPVLVHLPQPARYALHKLIVSQVRDVTNSAKSEKDLYQAYQLLSVLQEDRPYDILPAWENLISRGPKWKKNAEAGLVEMERRYGKLEIGIYVSNPSIR